jgi:hypothetical protein
LDILELLQELDRSSTKCDCELRFGEGSDLSHRTTNVRFWKKKDIRPS